MNPGNPSAFSPSGAERSETYAIFGNPVGHSLSPLMHNAAFAEMGFNARYVAFSPDDADGVVRTIREVVIRGASVTLPFKETVLPRLDEVEENARRIGAVNTILQRAGRLVGYNTDGTGLARDLEEWCGIRGKTFVVLGSGGAALAAVSALLERGGAPVVVARTPEKARTLSARFECPWRPLAEIGEIRADVLINTTPVGMSPETGRSPLKSGAVAHFPFVMDLIYNPLETRLLREAKAAGCQTRSGVGMFVQQGAEQILLWTGLEPPRSRMREVVMERLIRNERH